VRKLNAGLLALNMTTWAYATVAVVHSVV